MRQVTRTSHDRCTKRALGTAILYLVLERRVHGNNLDDFHNDIVHREDTQKTALLLIEFIDKKGDEKWVEDLQGAGPWLMVQLADMASLFESARKSVLHLDTIEVRY